MCNLYSLTKGLSAILEFTRARWGMPTPPSFVKGETDIRGSQ